MKTRNELPGRPHPSAVLLSSRYAPALLVSLLFLLALSRPARARAAAITPFLDEVIVNDTSAHRATAYFGYTNPNGNTVTINVGQPDNYFFQPPQVRAQPAQFLPGTHHYAFAVVFDYNLQPTLTWILNGLQVSATGAMAGAQTPQTTLFTYQGRLTDGGAAAGGAYQMRFTLFDSQGGGTQIGPALTFDGGGGNAAPVQVADGVFTVQLDFGLTPFTTGANRFLQVEVRRTSSDAFVALTPRQQITSTPYAVRSFSAATADSATSALNAGNADNLNNVAASQYVLTTDARLADARQPAAGSANYIQNTTAQQATSNFNVSGNGTAGGTLSGNVVNAATQFNLGGSRILGAAGTNNLFVGVNAGTNINNAGSENTFVGESAGAGNTTGNFNSFVGRSAGASNTLGGSNSFFGLGAGGSNTTGGGNSFFGTDAGVSNTTGFSNTLIGNNADVGSGNLDHATAVGADALVSTSSTILLGRANGLDKVRVPGLGLAGATALCRNANSEISTCSSSLRYKTNIAPFSFGLSFINQLRPISFDWKADGMKDVGFGAEDVARINPLFVTYNARGEVEGVKYDRFSVLFVNAFKEQQAQIERQQKQIAVQQQQLDELKRLVCQMKPDAATCRQ